MAGLVLCSFALVSSGIAADRQPSLLVLDFAMTSPDVHESMIRLFSQAGYRVDYRPDFPQLTKRDLHTYDAIMLLAGGTPDYPGAMLTPRAIEPLKVFVRSGGVLMLGAPANPESADGGDEVGENERTLFNTLLRRLDLHIVITKGWLSDPVDHYVDTLFDAPWIYTNWQHPLTKELPERLQLPRTPALQVGAGVAVLLSSSPTATASVPAGESGQFPVLAMGKNGKGLVVVTSRYLLNPTGSYQSDVPLFAAPGNRSARRELIERMAGYTVDWLNKRAEWVPTSVESSPWSEPSAVKPPFWKSIRLPNRSPVGTRVVTAESMRLQLAPDDRAQWRQTLDARYQWMAQEGIRAGWVYVDREPAFQRAVRRVLVDAKLNMLWGSTDAELLTVTGHEAEKNRLLAQWANMDALLQGSRVKWFMGSHYPGAHAVLADYPPAVGAQGQTIGGMSPLDWNFWEREILPVLTAEAEFSRRRPSVAGLVIDLEMYPLKYWYFNNGFDFGEVAFRLYLQRLAERRDERLAQASALAPSERFGWLMEQELLGEYRAVLRDEAERIGRRLRDEVHRINPRLILGFYAAAVPSGWLYDGLLQGAGDPRNPILLLTFQQAPDEELDQAFLNERYLLHVAAILLGQVRKEELREAIHSRLAGDQGYWLNNMATLASDDPAIHHRGQIESPREGSAGRYLEAIASANRSFRRGAAGTVE